VRSEVVPTLHSEPDLDALKRDLRSLLAQDRDEEVLTAVLELVSTLAADNRRLAEQLASFARGRAHGGSERISSAQLMMFMMQAGAPTEASAEGEASAPFEEESDDDDDDHATPPVAGGTRRRKKKVRVVGNVERVVTASEPSDSERICPDCGKEKSHAGSKRRLLVEVVPAQFRIVEYVREQYACRGCDEPHMVIGPPAPTPCESGILSPSLLADFICRKHVDHEPVNHIAQTYLRMGIEIPLGTLYGWVKVAADLLEPIAKLVLARALGSVVLQVDDTGVTVLDDDVEKGSRRGHLWSVLGDGRWAAFRFTPDWKAERVESFLGVRQGWMQGDAYAGYDRFYGRDRAIEVGCWAHARRYFVKALDVGDARAARALDIIQRLFKVERRAEDKGYSDPRRLMLRNEKSRPLLNELGHWVDATHATAPPDTPLGRAITYLTNQWQALVRFLEDGRLRLTNNDAERQLRHIALGRNAWLFTGSDQGGERLAILFTCVATCKLVGVDPRAWMLDVVDRLVRGWPASRIDELLPPAWALAHKPIENPDAGEAA
jgi:transposase